MNLINDKIVEVAQSFIGMHEIPGNMGWDDKEFEELMITCGWKKKQAWCCYFAELIWKKAYSSLDSTMINLLDILFSGSVTATFNSFRRSKDFEVSEIPIPGAIVIWQYYRNGKASWMGHAGIVVEDKGNGKFSTIEGNTSGDKGREGEVVRAQSRALNFYNKNGLRLRGFIYPKQV